MLTNLYEKMPWEDPQYQLHSGSAKIVRLIDYMIGRLNGQYFPGDPSLYRSKKANVSSHESNSAAFNQDRVPKTSTLGSE